MLSVELAPGVCDVGMSVVTSTRCSGEPISSMNSVVVSGIDQTTLRDGLPLVTVSFNASTRRAAVSKT